MHFCSTSILGMGFCQSWFPIFQFPKSNYFVKTFWPWIVDKIWILLLMCYMSLIGEILQLLKLLVFSFKLLCNIGNHIDLNPNERETSFLTFWKLFSNNPLTSFFMELSTASSAPSVFISRWSLLPWRYKPKQPNFVLTYLPLLKSQEPIK